MFMETFMIEHKKENEYIDEAFVGREDLLKKIDCFIQEARNTPKIILLKGDGGVGKTFLIKKFISLYLRNNNIFNYDFDDHLFISAESIRFFFAKKIGFNFFQNYEKIFNKIVIKKAKTANVNREYLKELYIDATTIWKDDIEKITSLKDVVIFFDTLDALSTFQVQRFCDHFLIKIPDKIIPIIVGRNKSIDNLNEYLKTKPLNKNIELIALNNFNNYEADEFIKKYLEKVKVFDIPSNIEKMPPSTIKALIKKHSNNTPILLDLALRVLINSGRNDKFLVFLSETQENKDSSIASEDFNKFLVQSFLRLYNNPFRELVLVLAHMWPLRRSQIKELLKEYTPYTDDVLNELLDKAANIPYIKVISSEAISKDEHLFRLHDVMREIINNYAWRLEDKNNEIRISWSHVFLKSSYEQRSELQRRVDRIKEKLKENRNVIDDFGIAESILDIPPGLYAIEQEKQRINIQIVRHESFLDPFKGFNAFFDCFYKGGEGQSDSIYIEHLINQLEEAITQKNKIQDITDWPQQEHDSDLAFTLIAKLLDKKLSFFTSRNWNDKIELVIDSMNKIDASDKVSESIKQTIKLSLANYDIKQGNFTKARDALNEIENNFKKNQDFKNLANTQVTEGWVYRLMGNITKALEIYTEAHENYMKYNSQINNLYEKTEFYRLQGTLFQTWAYPIALSHKQGCKNRAKEAADHAIELFTQIDFKQGLSRVQSVLGRVEIEFNEYKTAIEYFDEALKSMPEDDDVWYSKILLGKAHALILRLPITWDIGSKENYDSLFDEIQTHLKKVESLKIGADRVELLYLQGVLKSRQLEIDEADSYFNQCEKRALEEKLLPYFLRSIAMQSRIASYRLLLLNKVKPEGYFESQKIKKKWESTKSIFLQEGQKDILAQALFERSLTDLYFLEHSISDEKIINLYKKSLPKIAKEARFHPSDLTGQLLRMQELFELYIREPETRTTQNPIYNQERLVRVQKISKELANFWKGKPVLHNNHAPAHDRICRWAEEDIANWLPISKSKV